MWRNGIWQLERLPDCGRLSTVMGINEIGQSWMCSGEIPILVLFNLRPLLKNPLCLWVSTVSQISLTTIMTMWWQWKQAAHTCLINGMKEEIISHIECEGLGKEIFIHWRHLSNSGVYLQVINLLPYAHIWGETWESFSELKWKEVDGFEMWGFNYIINQFYGLLC